jgi:formimidoylglutamate deiminase
MEEGELKFFHFQALLLQQGWLKPAYVGIDDSGIIQYLSETAPDKAIAIEMVQGIVLPGFPNAHSHAFQYAMAGMAEKHQPGSSDNFWTWREKMYECALSMDPEQIEAVAAMLYAEMLRHGYTHVAEFHYLHHDRKGGHYSNLAEIGERLIAAAETAGIKITLIPVFYQKGGFGLEPELRQRRFISHTLDEYLTLVDATHDVVKKYSFARLGFGVHSLRAVSVSDIFRTVEAGPKDLPFHLHAAEQKKEIYDCLEVLKQRPVEWLLDNLPLKERFNLVHCTHLTDEEVKRLAKSGANVVLCPGTEANLGDGIFRLHDYANHYGNWCIGTDSQISLNPLEDIRWLDYTQRLVSHQRNTFDDPATIQMNKCIPCGRAAMGLSEQNFFELGKTLDAVVFDSDMPLFYQGQNDQLLPSILYTADSSAILGTLVNGAWVVRNKVHTNLLTIRRNFRKTVNELRE